jgi:C4-dicarboxylate transporter, DctQ subunit
MRINKKGKLSNLLLHFDVYVASIALVFLVGFTFLGVIMRYIVGQPLGWIEEIQAFLIVWVVFAAGGAAYRTRNHSAIDVLYDIFPESLKKLDNIVIGVVVVLVLLYLFYTSITYLQLFMRTGRKTSVLQISYILIYSVVPVSCFLQVLNYVLVNIFGLCDESVNLIEDNANE